MKNAIVTGGAGFIGSHIARELVRKNFNVTVIDNLFAGQLSNLADIRKEIKFVKGDIRNLNLLKKHFRNADYVFHEAAMRSVFTSFENPLEFNSVNVDGSVNVLEAARQQDVGRVICASSSSVYGDLHGKAAIETMTPQPTSPYAISKLAMEHYCNFYWKYYGLETVCLRYFNVFGPMQDVVSSYATVIPIFINSFIKNRPIKINGSGKQTRDFTFVSNVVEANLAAMRPKKAIGEAFNIGAGSPYSVNEVYNEISKIFRKKLKIRHLPMKAGDDMHRYASTAKSRKILNWQPKVSFKNGLAITVDWFRENYPRGL